MIYFSLKDLKLFRGMGKKKKEKMKVELFLLI